MRKLAEEILNNYSQVEKEANIKGAILAGSMSLGSMAPLALNPQGYYSQRFKPQETLSPLYQHLGIDPYQKFTQMAEQSRKELEKILLDLPGKKFLEHYGLPSQAMMPRPAGKLFDPKIVGQSYTDIFRQNPHLDPKLISKMHEAESLKNFVRKLKR